jgi:hypothetical protein
LWLQNKDSDNVRSGGGEREGNVSDRSYDYKTGAGTAYLLEVEREDDMSDCRGNYKTRGRMTYKLAAEREGKVSDCGCNYKARAGTTYSLEVEREGACQIAVGITKRGQGGLTDWR